MDGETAPDGKAPAAALLEKPVEEREAAGATGATTADPAPDVPEVPEPDGDGPRYERLPDPPPPLLDKVRSAPPAPVGTATLVAAAV
ncbi:DUF4173 domain-containing protein, partial [Streptomyces sp. SID8455]|nr:DUF4173 domain-containing protein [Streptomyces sp. SID8455]